MQRSLRYLLLAGVAFSCSVLAHHEDGADDGYAIQSLNTPDPIFTAADSIAVRVTTGSSAAARRVAVRLNGHDVTAALAETEPGVLTGTVVGLFPGINSMEVFKDRREGHAVAGLKVARARVPAAACSLSSFPASALPVPNTVVTSATPVAATATVPAHCFVVGTINAGRVGVETSPGAPVGRYTYAINWQARLPDAWNSKFHMPGGGGTDGSVPNTTARLGQGYAAAANDSGHSNGVNNDPLAGGAASFGTDYPARVDFAYNAIDVTTRTAKKLVELYYAGRPEYSYFEGCSMGGREAMMVTQRFPSYFNGVVSGDPAFRITKVGVWASYEAHQLAALARTRDLISGFDVPFANNTFTNQDLQLISNAVLGACDALDGVADGMVSNPRACTTRRVKPLLDALRCTAAKTPACLASDQVDAILNIYTSGAPNSQGKPQYAPWMWDAGIAGCTSAVDCNTPTATNINGGWRAWNVGAFNASFVPHVTNSANGALNFASLGGGAIPLLFATPPILPAPTANDGLANITMNVDFDTLAASIFGTSTAFPVSDTELLNVDDTDLSPFKRRGGKLIIWQGQTGGPFSPQDMVNWYTDVNREMGRGHGRGERDFDAAQSFARLFLLPGVNHCGGGPGTSTIDAFSPVVDWVENGNAPDAILGTAPATGNPFPGRTRPLCPYPAYAKYKGAGSIELAESFQCHVDPDHDRGHERDEDRDGHR
ncbi:MAG TPA: tannase/feruloyl esterase family alpha/beta hydrolase [Burkholderiales bacterium]|nr:tannase/feruloyl esterase family alpha/beta hydrolase [Burkholderiales bacterium]